MCRKETNRMGNMMRVVVLVRMNRIINDSRCMSDARHDSKGTKHTTDLIRHAPSSKHFDT